MLTKLRERWESRRRARATARRERARYVRPWLERYEERWCPYAAPTALWKGAHGSAWQANNFVHGDGTEFTSLPGTGDVVGVSASVVTMPVIDGVVEPDIGGLYNTDGVDAHPFRLTIKNGGSLALNPSAATASALVDGGGTSWITIGGTSAFYIKGSATFTLENASFLAVSGTSIGQVVIQSSGTFNDYPHAGNTIGCNVVVGDAIGTACTFQMLGNSTGSTSWINQVQLTIKSGSTLTFRDWTTAGATNIGFTDGNTGTTAAATILNEGSLVFFGASNHVVLEQLPIHNSNGVVDVANGAYVSLTNTRTGGFGSYNLLSDGGASAQVNFHQNGNITVTDPIEIDTGYINFSSVRGADGTVILTGGLLLFGGAMTVGSPGIPNYVTLKADGLVVGQASVYVYIDKANATGSQIQFTGTLTVGRPGFLDTPSLIVNVQDGSPPAAGGAWTIMTFGSRTINDLIPDGGFNLTWAGSGHNFTNSYIVSN